jgi:hypothetical protein
MNTSNAEVAPKIIELLDSLKPYGTNGGYPSSEVHSSNPWELTVGELYGCVCHRPFDELARSPVGSNHASGLHITADAKESRPGLAVGV